MEEAQEEEADKREMAKEKREGNAIRECVKTIFFTCVYLSCPSLSSCLRVI